MVVVYSSCFLLLSSFSPSVHEPKKMSFLSMLFKIRSLKHPAQDIQLFNLWCRFTLEPVLFCSYWREFLFWGTASGSMNEHASQIYFFQAQIQSKGIHPYHVGHAQVPTDGSLLHFMWDENSWWLMDSLHVHDKERTWNICSSSCISKQNSCFLLWNLVFD